MATVTIFRIALTKKSRTFAKKLVRQVLLETEFEAKLIASTGPYSTGRLADSIEAQGPTETLTGISGSVGSNLSYAKVAHNGAKIHVIFPKGAPHVYRFGSRRRPQLHFFWRKVGRAVYMPHIPGGRSKVGISHPGMEGLHYLTDPMRRVARRHGFRVIIRNV